MIYDILKNLSKGEKRYLSLNLAIYKNATNNKIYLKQLLAGKIDTDRLSAVQKNNLQTKIIKLLSEYNQAKKLDFQIITLIHQADYLSKKKLYDEADKLYNKVLNKCVFTENYALYFYALNKMQNNLLKMQNIKKIENYIKYKVKEIKDVSQRLISFSEYSLYTCRAMYLSRKNHNPKTKIEQNEFISFLNSSLLNNKKGLKDFSTAFRFNNIHALINYELGNIFETLKYLKKMEDLILKKPHFLSDYMEEYISVIYNMAVINMSLKKYNEAENYIKKLDDLIASDAEIKMMNQNNCYLLKINCYYESAQFNKIIALENELIEYLRRYNNPILSLVSYYILSLVYLSFKNHKESKKYISYILNDKNDSYREDIFCFARIINMIIQFEKNDFDGLAYSIINTKNYLTKKKRYYPLEKIFILYVKKIINMPDKKKEFIELMHSDMKKKIEKNPLLSKTLEYFDFISWTQKIIYTN